MDRTALLQIEAARTHAHQYVCASMLGRVASLSSSPRAPNTTASGAGRGEGKDDEEEKEKDEIDDGCNQRVMRDLAALYLNESLIRDAGDLLKV